jgi:dipeptidase
MKKSHLLVTGAVVGAAFFAMQTMPVKACTELYVGKDWTETGRTVYGRTEDGGTNNPKIYDVKEAGAIKANSVLADAQGLTYQWGSEDSYRYTSVRDQKELWDGKSETCYEAQGTNEYGVTISATESLYENEAVDKADPYAATEEPGKQGIGEQSLTTIVLGQAKTARQGIDIILDAVDKYTASEPSGIIVGDGNETWYLEIVSGKQYAAYKLPDDVCFVNPNVTIMKNVQFDGSTNRASTTTTDFAVSKDLINVAKTAGTYTDINGKTGADADGKTIDLNLSYSDRNSSARMKTAMDYLNPSLGVTTDNSTFKFAFTPNRKLSMDEIRAFFRLDNIARKSTMECTIFEYMNNSNDGYTFHNGTQKADPMSIVEWRTMAAPRYSIFVPFYPNLLKDTPASYQVQTADITSTPDSIYWTFEDATKLGNLFPSTIGKKVISDFAATENNIKTEFKVAQVALKTKSSADQITYATDLATTLSDEAKAAGQKALSDYYLPTVTANTSKGNSVSISGITKITDATIISSANDILTKLTADLTAQKAKLSLDSMRLFDINATGSGLVTISAGEEYAGKIAIVGHFHDGKWTVQQCTIDKNGNVEAGFASFSPVFVVPTTLTEKIDLSVETEYQAVYRLYCAANGEHLYTTDVNERDTLVKIYGWKSEGTAWNAPVMSYDGALPVYRLYNKSLKNHLYTTDLHEIDVLTNTAGWEMDNSGLPLFYSGGSQTINRMYNAGLKGMHLLTTDDNEYASLPKLTGGAWAQEGAKLNCLSKGQN